VIPRGFANLDEFAQFGSNLRGGLSKAGYADADAILQGSAVTGKSFKTGAPFDVGRVSDFDVALSGDSLLQAAKDAGIGLRSAGTRTGPLTARDLKVLGLRDLSVQMSTQAGRPVNFMIYRTTESAVQRAPSIVLPR
jgi:filamentous hemagglutinin